MNQPIEVMVDAVTGEVTVRELTAEEIAALPEPGEPLTAAPE